MVDSFNTSPPEQQPESFEPPAKSGIAGFVSSTTGKLVIGGVLVVLVLAAIGAILYLFVFNADPASETQPVPVAVTTETAGASEEASPTYRPADDWADTFAFRNIFAPTVKVTVTPAEGADGEGGEDGQVTPADIPQDTLYLADITTENDTEKAVLFWNGASYTLAEGEEITGTPWEVLTINSDSVVMLYGDDKITLTLGQGLGDSSGGK